MENKLVADRRAFETACHAVTLAGVRANPALKKVKAEEVYAV